MTRTDRAYDDWPLTRLLDAVERTARNARGEEKIALRRILSEIGGRTVTPIILVTALLLVSPLSSVPGVPTITAILIVLLALQALIGRRHLWLPQAVTRIEVGRRMVIRTVRWLRQPARWVDTHSHPRLPVMTQPLVRFLTLMICAILPVGWPALEFVPGVTSAAAAIIALFAFGLFTRDGYFIVAGYVAMLIAGFTGFAILRMAA